MLYDFRKTSFGCPLKPHKTPLSAILAFNEYLCLTLIATAKLWTSLLTSNWTRGTPPSGNLMSLLTHCLSHSHERPVWPPYFLTFTNFNTYNQEKVFTNRQDVISQKAWMFISTAVRASNLARKRRFQILTSWKIENWHHLEPQASHSLLYCLLCIFILFL